MIIDRYLRQEILLPFVVVAGVLSAIFLTYSLSRFLVDANAGLLLVNELLQLTMLKSLIALEVLLPLSFYLAVIAGLGRLYSDSEIYAMRSCGISELRLLRPVLMVSLFLALLIAVFSLFGRPWAYGATDQVRTRAEASSEADRIQSARFYEFSDSGRTIFVREYADGGARLSGIFIRSRNEDELQVITAARGHLEQYVTAEEHRLVLRDARVFKRVPEGPDLFAEFGQFSLRVPAGSAGPVAERSKSRPTLVLAGSENRTDRAELQWRLSTPLSTLLLAILAIPMSRSRPRQGRYARLLAALAIYALYFNLLDVSRTWVEQGTARSIWWVPALLAALVMSFYIPWHKLRLWLAGTVRREARR